MAFDPWASYNAGMQNLGQAFDTTREEQRQAPLRALQLRILQNKAAESDIATQQAQVSAADRLALRQKLAGAEPVTTTQIMPPTKAATALTTIPGAGYTQPQGDFAMPATPASPTVQAYNEGRVKTTTQQPDLAAIAREELLRQGNIEEAAKAGQAQLQSMNVDEKLAEMKAKVLAGNGDPVQYAQAKMQLDLGKEIMGTIGPLMKTAQGRQMAQSLLDGYKKAYPNMPGVQSMTIENFATGPQGDVYNVKDRSNGQLIGHYIRDPETGALKFEKANTGEYAHNVVEITSPDGKTAQKFQYNPETQKYDKPLGEKYLVKSQVPSVNVKVNAPSTDQTEVLARGVIDGTIDPDSLSKRGGLQSNVFARIKQIDPSFSIVNAGAGAKFTKSTGTMQSKALLNTINPLLDKLETAGAVLGNSNLPGYNKAVNFIKEQTGQADIVGFNNLRDDVVAEVERGLLGTGVLSDSKYLRAVKNINSAQSLSQLKAAIKNTRTVIEARLESLANGPNAKPASSTGQGKPSLDQIFK